MDSRTTIGDHATSVSNEMMKVGQNIRLFLRFFPPALFDHWKLRQASCAPGDQGDNGTGVSDEIDQKMKVDQNTWFFLRFFSQAHFDHWKLRQAACAPSDHGDHGTSVWLVGHLIIVSLQVLPF